MKTLMKIGLIVLMFAVFMLLFSFMLRTNTPQADEVARTSDAHIEAAGEAVDEDMAAEAPEPMLMKAAAPQEAMLEAEVAEEGTLVDDVIIEESKFNFLSTIWGIIILSMICTLISWSAVEQVMKRRRNVMLVSFHDAKGKKVMQAMANETSKKILEVLANGEMTESEIAEKLEMSISRIHYNIKQLMDAKMIQSKSFKYSEKGREMDVYSLTNKYFVIGPPEKTRKKK